MSKHYHSCMICISNISVMKYFLNCQNNNEKKRKINAISKISNKIYFVSTFLCIQNICLFLLFTRYMFLTLFIIASCFSRNLNLVDLRHLITPLLSSSCPPSISNIRYMVETYISCYTDI